MLRRFASAAGRFLAANVWELCALAGLGLVAAGLAWWCHPGCGLLAAGVGALSLGIFGAFAPPTDRRSRD